MLAIECHAVYKWDGGERHNFAFYLASKEAADAYKAAHRHDTVSPTTLVVFDSLEEATENETQRIRRRVWDKLTPIERKAIGMVEPPLS